MKYLLLLILAVAIFFRIYNLSLRFSLSEDSSRDVLIALEGAREGQFPLTGPFSSVGQFTFGPWYYYFLIIFTLIFKTDIAPWLYSGLASVIFVWIMYKIGQMLEGKTFALLVALLAALSASQISTATTLLNPNLVSFYAGLSVFFFVKAIKKRLTFPLVLIFGFVMGIGINHHYQMAGLLVLPVMLLIFKRFQLKDFVAFGGGVFLTFMPLFFFELNNHWYTIRNMFYYATEGRKAIYLPNRWLFYLRDFWPAFWAYCLSVPSAIGGLIIALFSLIAGFQLIKKKLSEEMLLLLLAFGFNFILLRFYWGERNFGYLQYFYPFIFLFSGFVFWHLCKVKWVKYFSILGLVLVIVLALGKSLKELDPNLWSLEMKRQTNMIKKAYPDEQFVLYNCQGKYKIRSQAMAFLLASEGRLSDSGRKIGLRNPDCPLLAPLIPDSEAFDFSSFSEEFLLKSGWGPISPKVVFDSTVRWWFKEKP